MPLHDTRLYDMIYFMKRKTAGFITAGVIASGSAAGIVMHEHSTTPEANLVHLSRDFYVKTFTENTAHTIGHITAKETVSGPVTSGAVEHDMARYLLDSRYELHNFFPSVTMEVGSIICKASSVELKFNTYELGCTVLPPTKTL